MKAFWLGALLMAAGCSSVHGQGSRDPALGDEQDNGSTDVDAGNAPDADSPDAATTMAQDASKEAKPPENVGACIHAACGATQCGGVPGTCGGKPVNCGLCNYEDVGAGRGKAGTGVCGDNGNPHVCGNFCVQTDYNLAVCAQFFNVPSARSFNYGCTAPYWMEEYPADQYGALGQRPHFRPNGVEGCVAKELNGHSEWCCPD